MANKLQEKRFEDAAISPFNAPIPGEALTSSPDNAKAWERPPEIVDEEQAMMEVYLVLTEQDALRELVKIIDSGVALDEIAQVILYKGYTEGKYNPDLMLMLIEPTLYLLISIADYAGIKDYVLYDEEENDPDTQIPDDNVKPIDMDGDGVADEPTATRAEPTEDTVSSSLLSKIKKELPTKIKEVITEEEEV
tara:strand:- start:1615 stop:2193 length:579 start_codon:yes stop_codon:yes gene_type:complete